MSKVDIDEKRKYWNEVIEQFQTSGLSQKKFCDQQNIKTYLFKYWLDRIKLCKERLEMAPYGNFAKVQLNHRETRKPLDNSTTIILESGLRIEFKNFPDVDWIKRLDSKF